MSATDATIAVYDTHLLAEDAVRKLAATWKPRPRQNGLAPTSGVWDVSAALFATCHTPLWMTLLSALELDEDQAWPRSPMTRSVIGPDRPR